MVLTEFLFAAAYCAIGSILWRLIALPRSSAPHITRLDAATQIELEMMRWEERETTEEMLLVKGTFILFWPVALALGAAKAFWESYGATGCS
ncbi:hypothetical protein ABLN87_04375 [Ruegeria sp. SCPT10]|uniref:hypothetical protein n=1 Tax=Ruegeria sp. SCP10 TaxID=3141377 RepID=UPI00333B9FC2